MKYDHDMLKMFIDIVNGCDAKDMPGVLSQINGTDNMFRNRFVEMNEGTQFGGEIKYWHINNMFKQYGFRNWRDFKTKYKMHNHRVVSVKKLDHREDTGTLTIDQNHELHDYHTFALDCGVYTYNSFWFPKPEGSEGTTVTTVGGDVNWTELPDLEYFLKKLYISLKVPFDRFKDPKVKIDKGDNITAEEYRFAKFIMRLQDRFSIGLGKAFITHLKLKGIWDRYKMSPTDLKVELTPPASFDLYESQRLLKIKFENYGIMTNEHPEISKELAMKKCLGYSDADIDENNKRVEKEKLFAAYLTRIGGNVEATGNPYVSGGK